MRWSAGTAFVALLASSGVVAGACNNKDIACNVDTDCAAGQICREGLCGTPGSSSSGDAGAPDTSTPIPDPTSSSSGTTSSGTSCQDVFGICASPFDCCSGLTCTSGVCR